jgi:phage baseplate assembly protein W
MAISFKNVGVRQDETINNPVDKNASVLPIGIKTPLELSHGNDDVFVMHTDIKKQVSDNLKNLLMTNYGERLAQYNYGGNLRPLCSEYTNKDNFDTEAMLNINTAIKKWMPFITPLEFNSEVIKDNQNTGLAKIKISVIYSVPKLRVAKDQIDIYMTLM